MIGANQGRIDNQLVSPSDSVDNSVMILDDFLVLSLIKLSSR